MKRIFIKTDEKFFGNQFVAGLELKIPKTAGCLVFTDAVGRRIIYCVLAVHPVHGNECRHECLI